MLYFVSMTIFLVALARNKYVYKEVNHELEWGDATLQLVENAGRIPFLTGTAAYVEIKNKKSRTKIVGVKIATFETPCLTMKVSSHLEALTNWAAVSLFDKPFSLITCLGCLLDAKFV
jgi:hypothetical protein